MPDVVIVEGVYTLRPQLRDLVDVKVYVDADEDTRIRRQVERSQNTNEWIKRWVAAEDYYAATVKPWQYADVLVDGSGMDGS
jgi:phosphoribulokinase